MIDVAFFNLIDSDIQIENAIKNIREALANYIEKYKLKALVIGISGGVDSTLCAVLAKKVCEQQCIPLIGRSITIETNSQEEILRSIAIGKQFCHDFQYLDLTETYLVNKKLLTPLDDSKLSKLRQGNMKARMRMMLLYDLAQLHRGIVIATDNFTEYLTGFWTLHGDVGDYAPIIGLWKTEVYKLSNFLLKECNKEQYEALKQAINALPADGLGITNSDYDQLGVKDYFEADKLFLDYFKGNENLENHILIQKYLNSTYKRENPKFLSRNAIFDN